MNRPYYEILDDLGYLDALYGMEKDAGPMAKLFGMGAGTVGRAASKVKDVVTGAGRTAVALPGKATSAMRTGLGNVGADISKGYQQARWGGGLSPTQKVTQQATKERLLQQGKQRYQQGGARVAPLPGATPAIPPATASVRAAPVVAPQPQQMSLPIGPKAPQQMNLPLPPRAPSDAPGAVITPAAPRMTREKYTAQRAAEKKQRFLERRSAGEKVGPPKRRIDRPAAKPAEVPASLAPEPPAPEEIPNIPPAETAPAVGGGHTGVEKGVGLGAVGALGIPLAAGMTMGRGSANPQAPNIPSYAMR